MLLKLLFEISIFLMKINYLDVHIHVLLNLSGISLSMYTMQKNINRHSSFVVGQYLLISLIANLPKQGP